MISTLRDKLRTLEDELDDLYTMSEEAACFRYRVTYKEEAITALNEEIDYTTSQIDELEAEDAPAQLVDPAFRSIEELNRMFI